MKKINLMCLRSKEENVCFNIFVGIKKQYVANLKFFKIIHVIFVFVTIFFYYKCFIYKLLLHLIRKQVETRFLLTTKYVKRFLVILHLLQTIYMNNWLCYIYFKSINKDHTSWDMFLLFRYLSMHSVDS